ncbi:MAG: ParB/RepB/Spo0J family partition protein [Candidatus Eiseniibacteriota bacterium]
MHRKALGRGLEALIPGGVATATPEMNASGSRELALGDISPNPFQPRKRFDDEAIKELAASIRASGILQPILVRRSGADEFQLVAGERRLRAAGLAGLERIPAVIREVSDREMMELALIENIQRQDLDPIEEARAFQTLIEKIGLTHDQLSERVGKQRSSISNSLRLLALPAEVQDMVSRGTLSAGHARALLGVPASGDQLAAARYVVNRGFSVRRTEAFIRRKLRMQHTRTRKPKAVAISDLENRLQQRYGTRVTIAPGRRGGRVEFEYFSDSDLERLLELWGVL